MAKTRRTTPRQRAQQQKMATCSRQAKGLKGQTRKNALRKCLKSK